MRAKMVLRAAIAAIALTFLLLAGCTGGGGSGGNAPPRAIPLIGIPYAQNWWGMAGAALLIGVAFFSATFMAGEFFGLPEAKTRAKQEGYELALSILLIVITFGMMAAWGTIAKEISTTVKLSQNAQLVAGACPENQRYYDLNDQSHPENYLYASADFFLGCTPRFGKGDLAKLQQMEEAYVPGSAASQYSVLFHSPQEGGVMMSEMMSQYVGLLTLEMLVGPVSTFGVSAYTPEALTTSFSLSVSPNAGLSLVSEATIMVTDLLGVGVGALVMQKVLLLFIHQNALFVFFPLGLALRGVPFLRKTGSTIIAVALILYFIYPLTIWINQQIYFSLQGRTISWANYASLIEICQMNPGEDPLVFKERIAKSITAYYHEGENIAQNEYASGSDILVLPFAQLQALGESIWRNLGIIKDYLFAWEWLFGPVVPVNQFFDVIVDILSASMQIFALNVLFIVNSIIICVTLFRDLSLAIGGEPRIFGISKLV